MAKNVWLVSAYEFDRYYGGPEEGGWWYTQGEILRTLKLFRTEDAANDYCRRMNEKLNSKIFGPNAGRRSMSSVTGDTQICAEVHESRAPQRWPENRPRYE
jgi:hypothetical protein